MKKNRNDLIKELQLLKGSFSHNLREENENYKQMITDLETKITQLTQESDNYRRQCRDLQHNGTLLAEYKDKIVTLETTISTIRNGR